MIVKECVSASCNLWLGLEFKDVMSAIVYLNYIPWSIDELVKAQ